MDELLKQRKDHHIDIVLDHAVASHGAATGLGGWRLEYDGLPEIDFEAVDLSVEILGKTLRAPICIGAMTGGTDRAAEINHTLARAAARTGVGMALGSQRAMLEHPETVASFDVRRSAPDLPLLFGNVGAVQLNYGVGLEQMEELVSRVGADVLNVHLNPLQEVIQPEGDTRFSGLLDQLMEVVPRLSVPVVVKEVGAGISARTADKLVKLPIAGVEVAGTGGTSWAAVESHRADGHPERARAGQRLAGFGVPTADAIQICRKRFADRLVIGSGGIKTGMDMAVALALGADLVCSARPFLQAAMHGEDAVVAEIEALIFELRAIAFCTGITTAREFRQVAVCPPMQHWASR